MEQVQIAPYSDEAPSTVTGRGTTEGGQAAVHTRGSFQNRQRTHWLSFAPPLMSETAPLIDMSSSSSIRSVPVAQDSRQWTFSDDKTLRVGVLVAAKAKEGFRHPIVEQLENMFLLQSTSFKFVGAFSFETANVRLQEDLLKEKLLEWVEKRKLHLIITVGGIGFAPHHILPEVLGPLLKRRATGLEVRIQSDYFHSENHFQLIRSRSAASLVFYASPHFGRGTNPGPFGSVPCNCGDQRQNSHFDPSRCAILGFTT